jgi:hypothetical protein
MAKYFSFWSLLLICFASLSKERGQWLEGKIMLRTGEELHGIISYNPRFDVISLYQKNSERMQCFSATKVSAFEYYDKEYESIRKYVSYSYTNLSTHSFPVFFEIILTGKITLMRRPTTLRQTPKMKRESLNERFGGYMYFVQIDGTFISLKKFRGKIFPLLHQEYTDAMDQFIENNDLTINNRSTQIKLIDFYNFLSNHGSEEEYELYTLND